MTSPRLRVLTTAALLTLGAAAFAGCAASGPTDGSGPTDQSVALLEEFFAHLEKGETTEAAAMTSIDFPEEFLDEDFYAASAALPSDAKVVDVEGSDDVRVTATVEYVLDDPENPMTASYAVRNTDGERTISWQHDFLLFINAGSPGRLVLNGEMEYPIDKDGGKAFLLPALYEITYDDPTGVTHLDADGTDAFTLAWPMDDGPADAEIPADVSATDWTVSTMAMVGSDVTDAVDEQIEGLQAACVAESLAGPSCPASVLEYGHPLADPSSVEWFRDVDHGLVVTDGRVEYSAGFTVRADGKVVPVPAVYTGTVTRDADGTLVYTRE